MQMQQCHGIVLDIMDDSVVDGLVGTVKLAFGMLVCLALLLWVTGSIFGQDA